MGVFSVGFNNKIGHGYGFKGSDFSFPAPALDLYAPLCSAHKIFQKKKKKKRKQLFEVKGFIKPSFPDEILPGGWRFYQEPKGLELGFMNTRNLSLLPFFYFLICS